MLNHRYQTLIIVILTSTCTGFVHAGDDGDQYTPLNWRNRVDIFVTDNTTSAQVEVVGDGIVADEFIAAGSVFSGGEEWLFRISGRFDNGLPNNMASEGIDIEFDLWHKITPPPLSHGEGEDTTHGIKIKATAFGDVVITGPGEPEEPDEPKASGSISTQNGANSVIQIPSDSKRVLYDDDGGVFEDAFINFPNVIISHGKHEDIFTNISFYADLEPKAVPGQSDVLEITSWGLTVNAIHTPEPTALSLLVMSSFLLTARRRQRVPRSFPGR